MLVVALSSLAVARNAVGQATVTVDTMRAALRVRDGGDFAAASAMLRAYLTDHPDNGDAARLLAETLYWQKDVSGAREVAEGSLAKHPEDVAVRLLLGRILVETGDRAGARRVLEPVLGAASNGRADALLGKRAYWDGDYSEARRKFSAALRADSAQPEVRQQLSEILVSTAPWLRAAATVHHDDQPIDALGATVEGGFFATPLTAIIFRFEPTTFRLADTANRSIATGELSIRSYLAGIRTEVEASGGGLQRSMGGSDWLGRLGLGFRLPGGVVLRARDERAPYLYTEASLSTPVMTSTATGQLDWTGTRGWLGQAVVQAQRYPDANTINVAYAWLLAPIIRTPSGHLQVGYSVAASNASETRFVLTDSLPMHPPNNPRLGVSGRYDPYYTPINLVEHSAVAAVLFPLGKAAKFRANGGYGVNATEDAPMFTGTATTPPGITRTSYRRSFSPWNARAALEMNAKDGLGFELLGEIMHTAFYTSAAAHAQFTYRFGLPARRALGGS